MSEHSTPKEIEYATGATWPVDDQAMVLRKIMQQRQELAKEQDDQKNQVADGHVDESITKQPTPVESAATRKAIVIAVSGGKGGVGKSNVSLNLSIALTQSEHKVLLIDANAGHGNADLLCGLNGYWNLEHVLSGTRTTEQVLLDGPDGLKILPGAEQLASLEQQSPSDHVVSQLNALETEFDYIVIDAGIAANKSIRQMIGAADCVLLVTSAEPTSIADTYATIKHLSKTNTDIRVAINMSTTFEQGWSVFQRIQQTTQSFLKRDVEFVGSIPLDQSVVDAVNNQQPFVNNPTSSPAGRSLLQISNGIVESTKAHDEQLFFERILAPPNQRAAA